MSDATQNKPVANGSTFNSCNCNDFYTLVLLRRLYEPGREKYLSKGAGPILAFFVPSFYLFSKTISLILRKLFFWNFILSPPLPKRRLVSRLCHELLCKENHWNCRGTNDGSQRAVWWRSSSLRSTAKEKT